MKKLLASKKGFTLVELIVVIVIIVILAAALVTSLVGYIQKATNTNALLEAQSVYTASQAIIAESVGKGETTFTVGTASASADNKDAINTKAAAIQNYIGSANIGTIVWLS